MLKKLILGLLITSFMVVCLSVCLEALPDPNPRDTGGGTGGGGGALWERVDKLCPDQEREKTLCYANGSQQCTAKYCN